MANVRLNIFENYKVYQRIQTGINAFTTNSLFLQGFELPGSISWNNLAILASVTGATNRTVSVSIGLYSLTGSTLSLANSASGSLQLTNNALSYVTLVTSATQDITPGNWYYGMFIATAGTRVQVLENGYLNKIIAGIAGVFVRGYLTVSTTVLPASIATSDLSNSQDNNNTDVHSFPYILLSA